MIERELATLQNDLSPPFACSMPAQQTTPLVFSSPHSGRTYAHGFQADTILSPHALRKSEDAYVDLLYANVVYRGAPLLAARFPRAYLDANREPNELDPQLIEGALPETANTQSARVIGGLGVIPRVVADGEPIYRHKIPLAVAEARLRYLYQPFHECLAALVQTTAETFGAACLIDCHSMPSAAGGNPQTRRPHFIIGDRFGTSCAPKLTQLVARVLTDEGFDVQLNRPYAGGFITEHYGRPANGIHALQIEINRGLYLDENRIVPSANFTTIQAVLDRLTARLAFEAPQILGLAAPHQQAAE
ncbi:MAG: N-formylglutamate amidohydrolase [Hyphomicrobiaceae bacterium]